MTRWAEDPNSSNQKGRNFEELIERVNESYLKRGQGKIRKNEPTVGILKNSMEGRRFTGYFKKKGKLDYSGVIPMGQAIAFEAKATSGDKFYLKLVKDHQVEKIREGKQVGEITFILIHRQDKDKFYILFADQLLDKYDQTPKGSFKWKDLQEVKTTNGLPYYLNYVIDYAKST